MINQHKLRDFQIGTFGSTLTFDEQRIVSLSTFATYEPIRLWLKAHNVKAPFVKLLVSFVTEAEFHHRKRNVTNVLGICEVDEPVNPSSLRENAGDHRWVIAAVKQALGRVAQDSVVAWRSEEFESFLDELAQRSRPLMHFIDKLARTDRRSHVSCTPWMAFEPGHTQFGVRFTAPDKAERDVDVFAQPGLLYLEDDFPVAKSKLQDGMFLLLDKEGNTLASVPIDERGMH
jgi:hypothetical protein